MVVAQFFGAKRMKDMKTAVSTTFIASGVLCAVLMVAGLLLDEKMLLLINTPAEVRRLRWA